MANTSTQTPIPTFIILYQLDFVVICHQLITHVQHVQLLGSKDVMYRFTTDYADCRYTVVVGVCCEWFIARLIALATYMAHSILLGTHVQL